MSAWNYWHVYHYMVTQFTATGTAPDREALIAEFKELDSREIDEGIAEFDLIMGKRKRGEAG